MNNDNINNNNNLICKAHISITTNANGANNGGTWPSGQRGALASQRSQVRIPAVAVN
jgi:hypothetical protein